MSNDSPNPEFFNRANAFINVANGQCDSAAHPNEVAAAFLYGAARFNAFIVAKTTGSPENMKQEKERSLAYLTDQFRRMMESNLDEFAQNFDSYMRNES
jgi:ABC-type amino acid transport substrate-binding protein